MQPNNLNNKQTTLYIRNMVSESCMKVVKLELERTGFIQVENVELGTAIINYDPKVLGLDVIDEILKNSGFALISNEDDRLVERIRHSVIQLIFFGNNNSILRNSDYLSEKLNEPYHVLSKVFSNKTGLTLEKFIIQVKMEKVRELISYDEMSLSEIANTMGYSSVQYLSNQFKQVTGVNVHDYKKSANKKRVPLNKL